MTIKKKKNNNKSLGNFKTNMKEGLYLTLALLLEILLNRGVKTSEGTNKRFIYL